MPKPMCGNGRLDAVPSSTNQSSLGLLITDQLGEHTWRLLLSPLWRSLGYTRIPVIALNAKQLQSTCTCTIPRDF